MSACYYLSTNIAAPMSDAAMNEIGHHFRDAFGAQIKQFGFATPQSMAGTSPLEVRRFAVDLLNSPSSYYFVAREGRVSVVPVTNHGSYATGSSGNPAVATATSSLSLDVPDLSNLKSLVGSDATSEADLQAFLMERPHFLLGLDDAYCEVSSHVALSSPSNTKLIPNFMIRCEDPARFAFIELKKPSASIQTRGREPRTVARSAAQAIKQLMEYAGVWIGVGKGPHLWSLQVVVPKRENPFYGSRSAPIGTPFRSGVIVQINRVTTRYGRVPFQFLSTLLGLPSAGQAGDALLRIAAWWKNGAPRIDASDELSGS